MRKPISKNRKQTTSQLTPELAALRCFAAVPLDDDSCAYVMQFLGSVQLNSGCDHEGDERADYAERTLRQWVGLSLIHSSREINTPVAGDSLEATAYDCAAIAYWLSSIEPQQGQSYCKGDGRTCGHNIILEMMDSRLLGVLGMADERPHRTTGEKLDAAQGAHPEKTLDELFEIAHRLPNTPEVGHG